MTKVCLCGWRSVLPRGFQEGEIALQNAQRATAGKELVELSKKENKPVSDLVRESLSRYIAIKRFRQLRNTVLPFAEAQGILTDEDVYSLIS